MENKEEKVVASIPEWSIILDENFTQNMANNRADSKKNETSIVEILKQQKLLGVWNKIFVFVSVIAVSLDPLFYYIPIINRDKNCIKMDKKLATSAVVLRSLTDIAYLIDIAYNIVKAFEKLKKEGHGLVWKKGQLVKKAQAVARRLSWFAVAIDFLAILPVPQVTILVFLGRLKYFSGSWENKFLNAVLLFQFVPRILRIYLSCMELTKTQDQVTRIAWVKGGLNFFLYILASHVFGGFWYLFSFERLLSCWDQPCDIENCETTTYSCDDRTASRNIELLNSKCPIKPENATQFDFGIFLETLESGMLESNDFPQKSLHCFWWGLRNLSSFGQNLQTSGYIWENCFAISISIIGLLLFLYLIGNLQTYMQLATTKSEEIGEKMKLKERDIELWITKNGLPKEMKTSIMENVKHKLEENKDVDVENLLSILPHEDRKSIKKLLCLPMLRKIPIFQNMNDQVLEVVCNHLKPVIYNESSYIIREGDPLDRMLFITQGTAWAYKNSNITDHHVNNINGDDQSFNGNSMNSSSSSSTRTRRLKRCDYFGEELLQWSLTHNTISEFPISTTNVKSHTKVEAFVFMANDLMNAVSRFWWLFRLNLPADHSTNSQAERWETLALSAVRMLRRGNKKKKMANSAAAQSVEGGGGKSQRLKYRRLHH